MNLRDLTPAQTQEWRDPQTGAFVPYALRVRQRLEADVFYLARWRELGPAEAARVTCERFGHDGRAGRCERCGVGVGKGRR